ncbi:hypothetical protein GGQ99_005129 [Aminobacter niigataensis]|uniref:Uncharacterized protein n=1 Tax=Aminobacter niigataensis TaxID=83265 RepID=A0ABR6LAS9_9HYPH|nr:hypothetical protein [Aminobacter niigataensis]MBB4653339.1 hypothetical protein [Aminobacter niigataensis]
MLHSWLQNPIQEWLPARWYGGFLDGLPDLYVGKLPAAFGRNGIHQWKVWIVENQVERLALMDALSKPVPMRGQIVDFASGPDAAVSKVDMKRHYGLAAMALYMPTEDSVGWPWITLIRLPSVADAGPLSRELARGVYSYEIDLSEAAAQDRVARMQITVMKAGSIPEIVTPDHRKVS